MKKLLLLGISFCYITILTGQVNVTNTGHLVDANVQVRPFQLAINSEGFPSIKNVSNNYFIIDGDYTIVCQNSSQIAINFPNSNDNIGRIIVVKRGENSIGGVAIQSLSFGMFQQLDGSINAFGTSLTPLGNYGQNIMFQSNGTIWYRLN